MDFIDAHIRALNLLLVDQHQIFNLGSGKGYSAREIIQAASTARGAEVSSIESPRRADDPAVLIADISKVKDDLGWQQVRDIKAMVAASLASFE